MLRRPTLAGVPTSKPRYIEVRRTADDPVRFLPLSPHQFHILLALTDGERYGYGVIQDVEQRTGGDIAPRHRHPLYTAIARLVALGLCDAGGIPAGGEDDRRRYSARCRSAVRSCRRKRAGSKRSCVTRMLGRAFVTGSGRNEAAMSASSRRTVRVAARLHRAFLWLVPADVRRDMAPR